MQGLCELTYSGVPRLIIGGVTDPLLANGGIDDGKSLSRTSSGVSDLGSSSTRSSSSSSELSNVRSMTSTFGFFLCGDAFAGVSPVAKIGNQ